MKKPEVLYVENDTIVAEYYHPKSDDYLRYKSTITIKASGKMPVEMEIKFVGTYPFAAPMPPEQHTFKAPSIVDLHVKYAKWFRRYGYIFK
jgi:hypothetical protein